MADAAVPVWEETTPVDESAVPVWEETTPVVDNRFAPTRRNWELMRQSFRGDDPLAFIDDPQLRENMRFITGQTENPDEERKKWALASYFSQNIHADIRFCHGNLDSLIAKFNNNEPQSIDNAYRDIGAALGVQQRDRAWFENSTAGAAISGIAKGMNTFFIEPPAFLSKLWVAANTAQMNAQLFRTSVFNPEAAKEIRDPLKSGEAVEAMIRNLYTEYYAPVEEAAWRDANVPDDWMTNSDSLGDWCRNAALSLVNYLPQLAMQTGLMAATGGVSALGTVYGISGYYDIKDDHPEMSEAEALVYGVGVGLINGVLEKVTLGILDGKVSKKVAVDGLKKGILQAARYFGWNAAKEGAEEGLEEFAQNLLDIAMGLRGDTGEWKTSDWWREMRRGVPESAFLGFATGGPLAFDSYRNLRQVALRREVIRSTITDRVEELSAKDSLSEREEQELEELQVVMDAGNPADMEKVVRDVYEREVIRNQEEANRRDHEADRQEEKEDLELTDDEIILRNAQRAERNQRLRRNLPHNPQETVETATELLRDFPGISLDIVYSIDELPEPVRAKIDAEGLDSNRIRAWVDEDSDVVHLIADRVRPSEVGRVIGHEVIGHKGLRAVFGDRFDSLLDLVYRDHSEEVAKLGDRYHRDMETLENRRYLTEEFLAECADAKVKPSWWKEFLGFVRQQLRRILPKMRFTDSDIEAALSRSARAMRRRNRAGSNRDAGMFFAVNENGETLFHITGRDNAMTAQEIIDDPTISPDDFVLTSEGSEIWGEITPEMVEKAGEKSGIKALPIKLQKGMNFSSHSGFGLAHLYTEHGKELEGKHYDLSALLTRIFGKPYQVYASSARGNIRLEMVTRNRPREIGVLELQEENGFYSVITAYQLDWDRSKVRGKLVWQYSVPQVPSDKQRARSIEPLSADKVASTARSSRTKPDSNINDSQEKSSLSDDSSHFSIAEDLPNAIRQKFSSGKTSLRQVASGFRKIDFEPGTVNLDLGGGKFDEGTRYLAERGVTNLVFDPVNRSAESNRKIFEAVKSGGVDTVTCNNVLNVIGEAAARDNVILQAAKALKPGGTAYFTVYEGDGSGNGRQSQADAWQENRKTSDYLDEIRKHFADVSLKNKVITARSPQVEGKFSFWSMDATFENPVRFSVAPPDENLAVVHNLSAQKLRRAAKLGGMPVPSLAIIDAEKSDFTNYGEISLIADKELIDPKFRSNRVFNADIYSARAPRSRKFYSDIDYENAEKVLSRYDGGDEEDQRLNTVMKRFRSGMYDSDAELEDILMRKTYAALNWYCKEHGIKTPEDWQEQDKIKYSKDFRNWWETYAIPEMGLNPEEKMFAGTTSSGRSKWIPLSLENVVKAMTKKVRNGEGFFYGVGNIRSMKAKQFKSISQIQKQRDNIVSPETMKTLKDEIEQELKTLSSKMEQANDRSKFGWEFNTAEDCLMAMAEGGYENLKYLHDRFGDNQELFQEMADFLDKLINMPTEYFEAKLQRAVGFDEFRAAVIPDDTPADVRKILEDAGLQIYTYSDESGRKAALQLATRENNLRFSLGEYSEADQRDIVAILQPYTGMNAEREPADYQKYLAEHGVEISEQDAWEFALEAVRQNIAFARKRSEERRNQWLYENYPLYKECVDFCGSADFKIKPSIRFSGEAFSGSWISPEFVKYSEKRKRGPKENEASYRRYQERREAALARAEGTASDEIAESIARRTGRDTLEVEQELIDFFRDLKKRDFYHEYTNFREEQILGDKQAARAAFDEWIQEEEKRIQNEVVELLEQGRPITAEWIGENKKVFDELYRQLFDGKTPPGKVGKADLEAINAAIMQQGSNAATFAQAYKVAREKAYGEFMEKLRAFRDKVMAANADAISLQRDAVSFAEQNLPAESRGEFTRGILKLMEFSTAPSGKYPEGRRMHEFRRLVERMVNRAGELRKSSALQEIREMLDAVKVKRNYKGIATAVIPSEQERVDRIRRVIDMNIASIAKAVDANNEQIMKLEESGEEPALLKKYQEDNQLLEMFGDLEHRSANDVETAAEKLKNIVFGGKMAFFDLLSKRRDKINDMRSRALDDITFGKLETFVRVDPEYFTKYWLKNQSLGTLMRLASGKSIQDFDNSVFGELYREVEDSTQTEQTALRRMQRDFDEALRTICGVDGNYVSRMKRKGKFFRMIAEVNENSGVFKTEFSRGVDLESKKYPNKLLEHGRRAVLKKLIPVEDSEFHGETREGARSLLRRIDNGEAITEWDGFLLDDITIDFLRQQLADFDAGLEQSYEIFNEKQDDENFNRLLADARKEAQVMLLSHSRRESRKQVEVPLSQGAALQLLLTWEQEEFQPNMKWNGWSEESMRQIKAFLKPEVLRMGYWMRDYIARNQKKLDDAVSKRYGAHLPGIRNYFPGVFKGPNSRSVESEFGRGYGTMSINPNFLISRKFHLKPADIDADAFSTFFGNQINQAHFLAWSDTIRDLNAVYGSMRVKNAITNHFGRGVEENIRERIAVLAQGGDPSGNGYVSRLFGKMFRNWVPAKIAINQSSIIKQILGTVSYMNHVPVMEFVKYSAKANFSNPEFREFVRWAKNTDYMKNRLAGGLDRDLSYLLNYTRDSRAYSPLAEGLIDLGTWGTRWSDAWSTLHGGYAVYMYALEQARQDGKTEAEAREAARRAWMRATDETQQSGYLKDQNYFQANQGGYRYLTAFMSNPIQTMNLQIQTMYELRYGKDKKAALQKLGRQILINHLLVPSLMIATTDLIRNGFDFGDWWDELEWEDYLIGWMLGSFESLFLLGKIFGNVGNYALDRLIGRKRPFYQSIVAFPMVEDISYDIGFLSKLIDSDKPVTEKEVFSAIRALGDFLMAGGIADRFAPVGPVGALLHAIGSQGKRISGWFDEK